jgi:hypothetical protein
MEDEEQDDQNGLVEQLTPTLHQECQDDVSASVQLVVGLGFGAVRLGLERSGGCHWVFTTHSDTVEELRPSAAVSASPHVSSTITHA